MITVRFKSCEFHGNKDKRALTSIVFTAIFIRSQWDCLWFNDLLSCEGSNQLISFIHLPLLRAYLLKLFEYNILQFECFDSVIVDRQRSAWRCIRMCIALNDNISCELFNIALLQWAHMVVTSIHYEIECCARNSPHDERFQTRTDERYHLNQICEMKRERIEWSLLRYLIGFCSLGNIKFSQTKLTN